MRFTYRSTHQGPDCDIFLYRTMQEAEAACAHYLDTTWPSEWKQIGGGFDDTETGQPLAYLVVKCTPYERDLGHIQDALRIAFTFVSREWEDQGEGHFLERLQDLLQNALDIVKRHYVVAHWSDTRPYQSATPAPPNDNATHSSKTSAS